MTDSRRFSAARLFIVLGALWLAVGAFYKLFAGNPGDLPKPFFAWFDWMGSKDMLFIMAIATELVVIVLALFRPKLGWIALLGVYLMFEAILAPLIASGAESCGCMGGTITIKPIVMASIDAVIIIGLIASRPWKAAGMQPVAPTAIVGLLAVAAIVAPVLKFKDVGKVPTQEERDAAAERGEEVAAPKFVTLTPPEWIGQSVYDSPLAAVLGEEIFNLPGEGTWVFWRWTCDHCADHLAELAAAPAIEEIILIRVKEKTDNDENVAVTVLPQGAHVYHAELSDQTEWVLSTPADMKLKGDIILEARENIGH